MIRYTLTAEWRGLKRTARFIVAPEPLLGAVVDDADAETEAVRRLTTRDYKSDPVWANGRIVLRQGGRVVAVLSGQGVGR